MALAARAVIAALDAARRTHRRSRRSPDAWCPVRSRSATRALDVRARSDVSRVVTVIGLRLAAHGWEVLIGLYAYARPLILYSAWVSIALWDLVRQEVVRTGRGSGGWSRRSRCRCSGPVAYFAFGGSSIGR